MRLHPEAPARRALEGEQWSEIIRARRLTWLRHLMRLHPEAPARRGLEGETWREIIRARRLTWLGHLMRLHPETPARRALEEYLRKVKRPRGRPKATWTQIIRQDLNSIGIKLNLSKATKALNRFYFRAILYFIFIIMICLLFIHQCTLLCLLID